MPRIRKVTPDGRSTIIFTVDQMPGARLAPGMLVKHFHTYRPDEIVLIRRQA